MVHFPNNRSLWGSPDVFLKTRYTRLGSFTPRSRVPLRRRHNKEFRSQQLDRSHCTSTPTRNGRLQTHVWPVTCYCLECTQLLLSVRPDFLNYKITLKNRYSSFIHRCGNVASILELDEHLGQEYKVFHHAPSVSLKWRKKELLLIFDYFCRMCDRSLRNVHQQNIFCNVHHHWIDCYPAHLFALLVR